MDCLTITFYLSAMKSSLTSLACHMILFVPCVCISVLIVSEGLEGLGVGKALDS